MGLTSKTPSHTLARISRCRHCNDTDLVLFDNITCYTKSLVSHTHVNTTKLLNITCTSVTAGTGWSSSSVLHENLPIIVEESTEYTSNEWKRNRKMSSTCYRLDLESLGPSPTDYAQATLPGHWSFWSGSIRCSSVPHRSLTVDDPCATACGTLWGEPAVHSSSKFAEPIEFKN